MMMPIISLLLPTRGRPAFVERLFQSIVETAADSSRIEVVLYVDDDDVGSQQLDSSVLRVIRIVGPRMSMGGYNSACLARASGDIIMLVNDDMFMRTKGWDQRLVELHQGFPDGVYLAYGDDLFKKRSLCTFPIVSRRVCELLVAPYPVEYRGAFIDVHLFDIFKRLEHAGFDRLCYLDEVVFEHLTYRNGKAEMDETYKMRGRFEDDPTFIALAGARDAGAKRLLNALHPDSREAVELPLYCEYRPSSLVRAIVHFSKKLLFDGNLPLRWRFFLCYWFFGRYLAARGLLRPFVQ